MASFPRKTLVVPFDFSDESFAAAETALELADANPDIHVIHVLPEMLHPYPYAGKVEDSDRKESARDLLAEQFKESRFAGIHLHVEVADPGHMIVDLAQEVGADLIVISSHGRSGVKRLLLGSVAERVVRLAHCPVLVLRK